MEALKRAFVKGISNIGMVWRYYAECGYYASWLLDGITCKINFITEGPPHIYIVFFITYMNISIGLDWIGFTCGYRVSTANFVLVYFAKKLAYPPTARWVQNPIQIHFWDINILSTMSLLMRMLCQSYWSPWCYCCVVFVFAFGCWIADVDAESVVDVDNNTGCFFNGPP